jgi:hypothetical protein
MMIPKRCAAVSWARYRDPPAVCSCSSTRDVHLVWRETLSHGRTLWSRRLELSPTCPPKYNITRRYTYLYLATLYLNTAGARRPLLLPGRRRRRRRHRQQYARCLSLKVCTHPNMHAAHALFSEQQQSWKISSFTGPIRKQNAPPRRDCGMNARHVEFGPSSLGFWLPQVEN